MKKIVHLTLIITFPIVLLFGLTSYSYYNTFGIDSERIINNSNVAKHYYRFWWTGRGDLLIGKAIIIEPYNPAQQYDAFDLGAAFFRPPTNKLTAKTFWNRIGFWYINKPAPIEQFWIGIPASLPLLFIIGYFFFLRKKSIKSKPY
ncbi:MAG: hypothetical protein KAG28_08490 [Cocleimonas sp.]|nr:hypothetical protein [Cocleimonas sp.]